MPSQPQRLSVDPPRGGVPRGPQARSFAQNGEPNIPFLVKIKSMSMSKSTPAAVTSYPEIESADLEAARRFLTANRDEDRRALPAALPGDPKGPTLRNGITRARFRSAAKAGH